MNAYEYYRALNPEISKKDYKTYIEKYKNSQDEKEDLKKFYNNMKGDMKGLLEHIIASENCDIPRFIEFFNNCFKDGSLKKNAKFDQTKEKIRLLPDEKVEAKAEKQKIKEAKANRAAAEQAKSGGSIADLEQMILAKRDNAFGGFLNYMENKYGGAENKKRKNL